MTSAHQTKHMQAVWLENGTIRVRDDVKIPQPEPHEALIQVSLAGICGTDLQLLKGYYPFCGIPGHEFVGKVINAPGAPRLIGKRVVGEINIGCGRCEWCAAGLRTHCAQRQVLGIKNRPGAFAQFVCLPGANLHVVPDGIGDAQAVFTEPLAAASHVLEQVSINPGHKVVIIGAGRLGLLLAQVVKRTGCQLQVLARHDNQRQMLQSWDITAIDERQLTSRAADVVIEASGSPQGLHGALQAVKPTGTIVLKSTYAGDTAVNLSPWVVNETRVIGSRCGRFEPALALLENAAVDPTPLITARLRLSQAHEAFERAAKPGGLKVLLQP